MPKFGPEQMEAGQHPSLKKLTGSYIVKGKDGSVVWEVDLATGMVGDATKVGGSRDDYSLAR